jgi:folate-dependent phosphoribosylglycinamide formyltransferase PurN
LEIAKKWGVIPYVIPSKSYFPDRWANSIYQIFNVTPKIHLAVMGGFLAHLPIREGFENKILNIHPSLLPKFGGKNMHGANVHREVLKAKEKVTGCTVHVVDEIYDHGPILAQQEVPILSEDTFETLQERVQEEERRLYPKVIKEYLQKIYP